MEKSINSRLVLVDTGIIYALADKTDRWHQKAVRFFSHFEGRWILPDTVIPEACYLINKYLGPQAEIAFVKSLAGGELSLESLYPQDIERIQQLLETYSSLNIGFVDASVLAIAERRGITQILTTDRRHFSVVTPKHCKTLTLLPE
jgi:hypothetical protein